MSKKNIYNQRKQNNNTIVYDLSGDGIKGPNGEDIEIPDEEDDDFTVCLPDTLMGNNQMNFILLHIRNVCNPNIFISDSEFYSYIKQYHCNWRQLAHLFHNDIVLNKPRGYYFIPIFTGAGHFGHWHLVLLYQESNHWKGLTFDSSLSSRQMYWNIYEDLGRVMNINIEWDVMQCVRQGELECGPRTIAHCTSIINTIHDEGSIHTILTSSNAPSLDTNELPLSQAVRLLCVQIATPPHRVPIRPQNLGFEEQPQSRRPTTTTNNNIMSNPCPMTIRKSVNQANRDTQKDLSLPTFFEKGDEAIGVMFMVNAQTYALIRCKFFLFCINTRHIPLLDHSSKTMICDLIDTTKRRVDSQRFHIIGDKSYLIANTKKKPNYITTLDAPLVVSSWSTKTLFHIQIGKEKIWVPRSQITNKELLAQYYNKKKKMKYNNKETPPVFDNDGASWGDIMQRKDQNCIRIVSENINNLGVHPTKNEKQNRGRDWLIKNEVDICCWQEVGVNWGRFKSNEKLQARLSCPAWDNIRTSVGYNKHERQSKGQYGGTATMAFDHIAGTIHATHQDPRGLGRWSSILFLGRDSKATCVISAYNPCKVKGLKPDAVHTQHRRYFTKHGIDVCPRKMLENDLSDYIESLTIKGTQIILCLDLNEDVTRSDGPLYQTLLNKNHLVNVHTAKHPNIPLPATYDGGSRPIDAILVSHSLVEQVKTGWIAFGKGIGDHRIGFLDVNINTFIGKEKYEILTRKARRLQTKNESTLSKYLKDAEEGLRKYNVLERLLSIRYQIQRGVDIDTRELEVLDNIRTKILLKAEKNAESTNLVWYHTPQKTFRSTASA